MKYSYKKITRARAIDVQRSRRCKCKSVAIFFVKLDVICILNETTERNYATQIGENYFQTLISDEFFESCSTFAADSISYSKTHGLQLCYRHRCFNSTF